MAMFKREDGQCFSPGSFGIALPRLQREITVGYDITLLNPPGLSPPTHFRPRGPLFLLAVCRTCIYLTFLSGRHVSSLPLFRRHLPPGRTLPVKNKPLDKKEFAQTETRMSEECDKSKYKERIYGKLLCSLWCSDVIFLCNVVVIINVKLQ